MAGLVALTLALARVEIVSLLLDRGANIDLIVPVRHNTLIWASRMGRLEVVKWIASAWTRRSQLQSGLLRALRFPAERRNESPGYFSLAKRYSSTRAATDRAISAVASSAG